MSCDHNREKFFEIMAQQGSISADTLERTFQQNRRSGSTALDEAKTRQLFAAFTAQGLHPPTHSADGLPKPDARPGYAAVYDLLRQKGLLAEKELLHQQQATRADGRDANGLDRWGYDKDGFDAKGRDRDGYKANGLDTKGYNRHGFDVQGYDRAGFNAARYNWRGLGRDGLTFDGYDPATGLDIDGYDKDGYDAQGYDRTGFDKFGKDHNDQTDPNFAPDSNGIYPDGFDQFGFGSDGYNLAGYDRYGFGRDGYNRDNVDRNGYKRDGRVARIDLDGYDSTGYKSGAQTWHRYNRAGFDEDGFNANGWSVTGFDRNGLDARGMPRMVQNKRGQPIPAKFRKDGFDEDGYDRWGFHKDTGLSAPDANGQRVNTYAWVYDEQTKECFNPKKPSQRVPHRFYQHKVYPTRGKGMNRVICTAYIPPAPPPPVTPFASMSEEQYDRCNSSLKSLPYKKVHQPDPTVNDRRRANDPKACKDGVRLRCPHCGQFTGGSMHTCPAFNGKLVSVYHSGLVSDSVALPHHDLLLSPLNPAFDPRFDTGKHGGYDPATDLDRDGYDMQGYNERGFNRAGYTKDGYDIFGYDRDGFDRFGYNNAGKNRQNERRGSNLDAVAGMLEGDLDLLANQDLARLYSQIATGLVGKPRKVVLQEGEGFATDMKGTIYADPYPLGRGADPRHNLIVTRAGIYHELGHEQFTPIPIWEQVLAVHQGQQAQDELGEAGRAMLPRFYNIVEDGRMEREVSAQYAGAAEMLAASCRLEPRWSEQVGPNVPDDEQVFWALLYTSLPYYRVRDDVKNAMTPRARALFDELSPQVTRAVHGSPEDAYRCALHLTRRFEEEGLLKLPPKEQDYSKPLPGGRASDEPSDGGGFSGQQDEPAKGQKTAAAEEQPQGKRAAAGPKDDEPSKGMSASADEIDEHFFSSQAMDAALAAVERDAAGAIEAGLRSRSRADTIGLPLHRPLPNGELSTPQRYRDPNGLPESVSVYLPEASLPHPELAQRRERHRQVANLMAKPLKAIREQTEQRLRRQAQGRLDRRQLVNAAKGLSDIYTSTRPQPETSFAASIAVDMSGSMSGDVQSLALYDSVMTLGDTFHLLDVPHEVRAFGWSSAQLKSMDEPFSANRAAWLAEGDLGGTLLHDTAGLAHSSLLARPEKNRLMICLSDGALGDHERTVQTMREARRNGVVTFGIFLGQHFDKAKLDELYGAGNWASIQSLSDMPKVVAQRLANIFKSMK